MNDIALQLATREAVSAKFRGHKKLKSKVEPIYPQGVEREFQRITDAYMKLLNQTIKEHLPEIKAAAYIEKEKSARHDDITDLMASVQRAFSAMGVDLEKRTSRFGLRAKIERMANLTRKLTIKEWKRAVHSTLGIDITDDYYLGELYRESMRTWVDQNVNLISSIPNDELREMKDIVQNGFASGASVTAITKSIQKEYGVGKRKARFIARDQLSKLASTISKAQQQDAGCSEYIWSTSQDSRVRQSHAALNGKKFRWDDPPIVDAKTGRRCHPGEDYSCRCVAIPVFDIESINLPLSGKEAV